MNVIRYADKTFREQLNKLMARSSLFDPEIEQRARSIVAAVQSKGDAALSDFTQRFDGVSLVPEQFAVTPTELKQAHAQAGDELRQAVSKAIKNVETFSRKALRKNWSARNAQGGKVGEKYDPFQRVGIYIPGGTAPLVSTAVMTATLARVAGCPEIVVCTPCGKSGTINPGLLYAANTAGATAIFRLGGAQAIAALALGTATIKKTQKIFGPGNAYVVAAKRLLFGHVAIDLLPGPSEVMVLADETARAAYVAADLLAQAEHGSGHERLWLVTTSDALIEAVQTELSRQLPQMVRRQFIEKALANNGWLIQVESLEAGIDLANQFAPEHCEIMTRNPAEAAKGIVTAGALCLGRFTPNVLGDYLAGPSHVLPTGGAGASFPGLTVDQFQRRTSIIQYDRAALERSLVTVGTFAAVEGLDAHARSAAIRLEGR
jgi:histidinol dehydrogenase